MRLLIFLPDDERLRTSREEALARYPDLARIELAALERRGDSSEELDGRRESLAHALRSAGQAGFVLLDPPESVEDLAAIDRLCLEVFGKGRRSLPRAVFFAPRRARRDEADPFAAYRATFAERFHHYHRDRRSLTFEKPAAKPLARSLKLARKAHSPIRWVVLGPMALTALGLVLVLFVLRDLFLRRAAIAAGQAGFEAVVEVADLSTTLAPALELRTVAVADRDEPMRNLFVFERFATGLDLGALVAGRWHMTEASLEGLAFGTARETSGALAKHAPEPAEPPERERDDDHAVRSLGDALAGRLDGVFEELLAKLEPPALDELRTVQVAGELEAEAAERMGRLEAHVEENASLAALDAAQTELDALLETPVPPAVERVRKRLEDLGALDPEARLDELEAELTAVGALDFEAEGAAIEQAKAELERAESEVEAARKALETAVEIEDPDLRTLLKLPGILRDVRAALDGLESARKRVENARALAEGARADLERRRAEGDGRLAEVRASLERMRAGEGSDELAPDLAQELEAARREVAGTRERAERLLADVRTHGANLGGELDTLRRFLGEDGAFLEQGLERLRVAAQEDRARLAERYSLEAFDADRIVAALVGEGVAGWLETLRGLYDRLRPYLAPDDEADEVRVRPASRGVTYAFPVEADAPVEPGLWIERARFSGDLELDGEPFALSGTASDLSSSPRRLGKPAQLAFTAEQGGRRLKGDLALDADERLGARLELAGFALEDHELGGRYAPRTVSGDSLSGVLDATIDAAGLGATFELTLEGLRLAAPEDTGELDPALAALLADVYGRFDRLEARLELEQRGAEPVSLALRSNVGDELQAALEEGLAAQVAGARAETEAGLDARLAEAQGGAREAMSALGPRGEELLGLFSRSSEAAQGSATGDAGRLEDYLASRELPALGGGGAGDPRLESALGDLEARLEAESARLAGDHARQSGAVEALLGELLGTGDAAGAVDEALARELERLLKLK